MYKLVQLLAHKVCVYERLCSMATTVDLGNVIGPQGPQGVQGVQGPKGDTGPAGAGWFLLFLGEKGSEAGSTIDNNQLQQLQEAYPYVVMQNADGQLYLPCDKYKYEYHSEVPSSLDASAQTQDVTMHTAIKFTRTVTSQFTTEESTQDKDNVFTVDLDAGICWYSSELSLPLQDTTVYWNDIKDNPVAKFVTGIRSGLFFDNKYNAPMLFGCTCASVCKDADHNIVTSLPSETCRLLKNAWPYCFVIAPTHVPIQSVAYSYTLCVPVFSGGYNKDETSNIGGWYPYVDTKATQSTTTTCMYFKSVHTDVDGNYAVYKIDYVTGEVSTFMHSAVASSANSVDWTNVQNKPFNDVDSSILYINSRHTLGINMDIICPNYTLGNAATCDMDYSLAIGSDSISGGEYDIAIGTGAHTIPDNSATERHCNIAIGNEAVCDASTKCIAIGTNAIASGEASICIGQNSKVANATQGISLGNNAICEYGNSVALGAQSQVDENNQVSIGNSDIQRRLSNVANPTKSYDAVNLDYFKKNTPGFVTITYDLDPSKAKLNASKTSAQFPSISIDNEVYNKLFTYMYKRTFVPDSIIFTYINYGDDSIKRQVFSVSDSGQMYDYLDQRFTFSIYAQSFVHQQMTTMIQSASSTMLNLARVSLQLHFAPIGSGEPPMNVGPVISISVTSSSEIKFDSGRTYRVYLSFKHPV